MKKSLCFFFFSIATSALLFSCAASLRADDLALLSDEFENPTSLGEWQRIYLLEGWNADQLESWSIDPGNGGFMEMIPYSSTWFQDYRGVFALKQINGDFIVTTDVTPTNRAGTGAPQRSFSLAGVLVRAPRPGVTSPDTWTAGGENYIFLSLGSATSPGSFQFESKTTVDSVSTLVPTPGVPRASIRIARIGDAYISLRRPQGGAWTVHARFSRPDLPDTLQVGLTAYTDWQTVQTFDPLEHNQTVINTGDPDLIARFDYVRYRRPSLPSALEGLDLTDPGQVSDADLLAFLGERADAEGPDRLDLSASFSDNTLTLDFEIASTVPLTWTVGLTVGTNFIPLWSLPLPVFPEPTVFPVPLSGFPNLGSIAVWSTLTNGPLEVRAADIEVVDTQ